MFLSRTKDTTVQNDRYQPNQRPWNQNGRRDWPARGNPNDKIHIDLVKVRRADEMRYLHTITHVCKTNSSKIYPVAN